MVKTGSKSGCCPPKRARRIPRTLASQAAQSCISHQRLLSSLVFDLQDPENPNKRLYSVYIGGQESSAQISETGQRLSGKARISSNKAVRAGIAAVLTDRAASSSLASPVEAKEEKPKKAAVKKEKKEKTEEEKRQKEFQTDLQKIFGCNRTATIQFMAAISVDRLGLERWQPKPAPLL